MMAKFRITLSAMGIALILILMSVTLLFAHGAHPVGVRAAPRAVQSPLSADAACTGGTAPSVEGTTLPNCYQRNITVGGNARIIRVWYTTDMTSYTVDDETYVHGVTGEAQAADIADATAESWQAVFIHSAIGGHTAHEPYIDGCGGVLNIQLRDGKGWSGIAYWGSPGNCNIGIDAPMVSNGVGTGDDGVVFHEVQHYTQYSYDDGCYDDFRPLYPDGNSWIEGWANWAGKNATNAAGDADYSVGSYDSGNSYYDLDYTNLHAGYVIQQYGGNGAPGDPAFGIQAVYEHYRQCDQYDDIFVMDEAIKALTGGAKTEKWAFVDFEAAYAAYPYADPVTQPELVFPDTDDRPTGTPGLSQNVNMSSGSQSWVESSPEDWTGRYYRINPQSGCAFVELHVETQPPGGEVGINFLAINTTTPSVQRSAHIGDNATRLFAGFPANNRLLVNVASFDSPMTYEVSATCVTPTLNILEPRQNPGHAMVGAPDSPFATLTRFEVTSSGLPVSGIQPSTVTFDAQGDAATLVAGSFQEVGPGEYWAAVLPPVKPAGTTFVDYEVCLNATICDSENDALLYVDPGNVDTVYVFDESGSMATEDTPGEGTRILNAKKAGLALADLLRSGDRIGIIGHGAADNPPGCGASTGNCPNANITRLARINNVSVPGDIGTVKTAIGNVTDRPVWTNTGQGLLDAKDMLLANPGNTNPDHIILLSDGQENVNPLYNTAAVRDVLAAAGVCVDTIGLGPEAPGALLAQIAAQNCGTYRPVPTSGLGTSLRTAETLATGIAQLRAMGVPDELIDAVAAVAAANYYPGQLGVANANEYLDVSAEDSARVFHSLHTAVPTNVWSTAFAVIDKSVSSFRFLAAGKQPDGQGVRWVELLPPGNDPNKRWIPVSPPVGATPSDWDIRHDEFQDVVIVKDPEPGQWGFRVRYAEIPGDYIMNLSVQSVIRLEGNLLNLNDGRAAAGDTVPIVATLMDDKGLLPGAFVLAAIENEGGTDLTLLLDDGNHNDGGPGDGIYGFPYSLTQHGGSYGVRIAALFPDPADPSQNIIREWNGGFWIDGPQEKGDEYDGDSDNDGMPDDWEKRCDLIVGQNDARGDKDDDGLTNIRELELGTLPCRADTDNGGEQDGSEVKNQRNPLYAPDDKAFKLKGLTLRPLNQAIAIGWSQRADTHTNVVLCISTTAGVLGNCQDVGDDGDFLLKGLKNGQPYYLTLYGEGEGDAQGAYTDQMVVIPLADPIPPQGAFFIDGPSVVEGGDVALSRSVILKVDAVDTDSEYEGPAMGGLGSHTVAHGLVTPELAGLFEVSGDVEMRFANTLEGIETAAWEPLAPEKPWQLDCDDGELCTVFGQFRDGAGNESLIIDEQIRLRLETQAPITFLPLIRR